MATVTFTNQVASQALRGQSVTVSLNAEDSANLSQISVGMECADTDYGALGVIDSVDYYGHSFKVSPIQPDKVFGGGGYLSQSDDVEVTIS